MQSMTDRRQFDLVRTKNGAHGMIAEANRHDNTALVQFGAGGPFETISWWDLKMPNEETAERVTGAPLRSYYYPSRTLARVVPHQRLI